MKRRDRAVELFETGYNCAQAVFGAYCEAVGMDLESGLKISASFGGGMGRMREVCGCVSGMLMVAGMLTGSADGADQEQKAANYKVVQEMAEAFKRRSGGSIICRELLGLDRREGTHVPAKRTEEYYKKRPCIQLVQDACDVIEGFFPLPADGEPAAASWSDPDVSPKEGNHA